MNEKSTRYATSPHRIPIERVQPPHAADNATLILGSMQPCLQWSTDIGRRVEPPRARREQSAIRNRTSTRLLGWCCIAASAALLAALVVVALS